VTGAAAAPVRKKLRRSPLLAPFLQRKRREGAMAAVSQSKKACAVNPLKMSQPIGGALALR